MKTHYSCSALFALCITTRAVAQTGTVAGLVIDDRTEKGNTPRRPCGGERKWWSFLCEKIDSSAWTRTRNPPVRRRNRCR
jgi:hypothetical protein